MRVSIIHWTPSFSLKDNQLFFNIWFLQSIPLFLIPEKQLGTAYALIFWVQNWGLMGVPALIGFVLNEYCKGPVVDGMQTYDYTLPMWIFAGFGVAALFFALWLKGENKKKGYGLEEPNIKK